jgi:hypothetical protein
MIAHNPEWIRIQIYWCVEMWMDLRGLLTTSVTNLRLINGESVPIFCGLFPLQLFVFLCFNWESGHEGVLGKWRYRSIHSLTSALDGGERPASRPGRFTPPRKCPWYPLDRRLSGPQSRSGCGGEEKNSQPLPALEPPIIEPVAQHYTPELSYVFLNDEINSVWWCGLDSSGTG